MGEQHRQQTTKERLVTINPHFGTPLSPEVLRHNAYIAGFEDGATDAYGWDDYAHGMAVGGDDYLDGFQEGKRTRAVVFKEARARGGKPLGEDVMEPPPSNDAYEAVRWVLSLVSRAEVRADVSAINSTWAHPTGSTDPNEWELQTWLVLGTVSSLKRTWDELRWPPIEVVRDRDTGDPVRLLVRLDDCRASGIAADVKKGDDLDWLKDAQIVYQAIEGLDKFQDNLEG